MEMFTGRFLQVLSKLNMIKIDNLNIDELFNIDMLNWLSQVTNRCFHSTP